MSRATWLLIERTDGWQACKNGAALAWSAPASSASAIKSELDSLGYQGDPLAVGLHVNRCVSAEFEADADGQARQRDELLYDFEQVVPFSAEDLTAEFVVGSERVFGVGVPVAGLKPILEELQDCGVNIESVSPSTLLAIQAIGEIEQGQFVILASDCLECVQIGLTGVCQWYKLPANESQAVQKLMLAGLSEADSVLLIGEADRAVALINSAKLNVEIKLSERGYDDLVADSAGKIAAGELKNQYELNQPRLLSTDRLRRLRPAIHFALAGLGVGLLLVIASLAWQIQSYSALRESYRKDQEQAYSKIHTGAIPQSIKLRLTSEWKRIKQQTELAQFAGESKKGSPVAALHSLLVSLSKASEPGSLSEPFQFRVTAMNFRDGGTVSLYIDFKDRSDAEEVRQQLISDGFDVKSYPTRMRDGRVVVDALIQLKSDSTKST